MPGGANRDLVPMLVELRAGWGLAGTRAIRGILFGLGPLEVPFVGELGALFAWAEDEDEAAVFEVPVIGLRDG